MKRCVTNQNELVQESMIPFKTYKIVVQTSESDIEFFTELSISNHLYVLYKNILSFLQSTFL